MILGSKLLLEIGFLMDLLATCLIRTSMQCLRFRSGQDTSKFYLMLLLPNLSWRMLLLLNLCNRGGLF